MALSLHPVSKEDQEKIIQYPTNIYKAINGPNKEKTRRKNYARYSYNCCVIRIPETISKRVHPNSQWINAALMFVKY